MIKTYYLVTKPGIIFGNIVTVAAGAFLASRGHMDYVLLAATLIGLAFVIASACVLNNCIDRKIDEKMLRTKNRALVTGRISLSQALVFATFLGLVGFVVLGVYTNLLTLCIAFVGFIIYVSAYSICKTRSSYSTLIGSIAGGAPPVVGYCAVSGHFDLGALLVFLTVAFWQMPHFFAIALYRLEDYKAASIPVLPVKKGLFQTKVQMLVFVSAFMITASLLTVFGFTGYYYLIAPVALGCVWLFLCIKGFKAENTQLWARKMFAYSLLVIMALSFMMSLDVMKDPLHSPIVVVSKA